MLPQRGSTRACAQEEERARMKSNICSSSCLVWALLAVSRSSSHAFAKSMLLEQLLSLFLHNENIDIDRKYQSKMLLKTEEKSVTIGRYQAKSYGGDVQKSMMKLRATRKHRKMCFNVRKHRKMCSLQLNYNEPIPTS